MMIWSAKSRHEILQVFYLTSLTSLKFLPIRSSQISTLNIPRCDGMLKSANTAQLPPKTVVILATLINMDVNISVSKIVQQSVFS